MPDFCLQLYFLRTAEPFIVEIMLVLYKNNMNCKVLFGVLLSEKMEIDMEKIKELADLAGISSSYVDKTGAVHYTTDEIRQVFLKSMGYDVESSESVDKMIEKLSMKRILPDVISFYDNEDIVLRPDAGGEFGLILINEEGAVVFQKQVSGLTDVIINGISTGYYDVLVKKDDEICQKSLLIYAPRLCYQPSFLKNAEHIFGVSLMLYSLHSKNSIGIGDFGDLAEIVRLTAQNGGDVVGLNPLGMMSPCTMQQSETADVSPYRTLSRLFINYIYLDLRSEEDFVNSLSVREFMRQSETQKCIEKLNASEKVLYKEVLRLKLRIAELMFAYFESHASDERRRMFEAYKQEKGESLHNLCVFEAVLEKQAPTDFWRYWKQADINSPYVQNFIRDNAERINFFAYCHWLADNQLRKVQKLAQSLNMKIGLYTDMPIGAASNGCEVWENPEAYVLDCTIGAPADPMRPRGQSWGFTPYHPQVLKEQHYAPFIRLIRENMQISGALRIDHAMGLRRLFWGFFKENNPVVQGAYVYYDIKDLTAILCLESNRRKCLVIGEDLGTVPEGFREYMAEHGLLSYKVFCRQKEKNGEFIAPEKYQYLSLAQISTHDQATACGFWADEDIEVFNTCGLYVNEAQYRDNLSGRRKDCENMITALLQQDILSQSEVDAIKAKELDDRSIPECLHFDVNKYGAKTNSALFLVRLCDIYRQKILDNAPGTIAEYPNWRFKLAKSIEEIKAGKAFSEMMSMIAENRPA